MKNIQTFHQIRGTTETSFLDEVLIAYQKIADEHDQELGVLGAKYETIPKDQLDEYGRSIKEVEADNLGYQIHARDEMQQVLARSFVMAVCMIVENELGELCSHLQKRHEEKIPLKYFRGGGRGMRSRVDYIQVLTQEKFLAGNKDFELLIELRNLIAHNNGLLLPEKQKILLAKYKNTKIELNFFDNRINIEINSLQQYLDLMKIIMSEVTSFWLVSHA